jgi:hypothetical protein
MQQLSNICLTAHPTAGSIGNLAVSGHQLLITPWFLHKIRGRCRPGNGARRGPSRTDRVGNPSREDLAIFSCLAKQPTFLRSPPVLCVMKMIDSITAGVGFVFRRAQMVVVVRFHATRQPVSAAEWIQRTLRRNKSTGCRRLARRSSVRCGHLHLQAPVCWHGPPSGTSRYAATHESS